jgi:hypothetical protein
MRTATIVASALSVLATTASARIYGIAAPKTVAVGSTVKVEILAEDYIQSIEDVAIAFGLEHGTTPVPQSLGTLLSSKYLGPDLSNVLHNITAHVSIPTGTQKGPAVLTAFLFSLLGADYSHDISTFHLTTTVGDTTSTEYVESH